MFDEKAEIEHIGWAYGAADIALVTSAFDAEGIPLFIFDAEIHRTTAHYALALGGARLCVMTPDIERAVVLLRSCRLFYERKPRWGLVVFLATLSFFFGAVPMPIRAIYLTDRAALAAPVAG